MPKQPSLEPKGQVSVLEALLHATHWGHLILNYDPQHRSSNHHYLQERVQRLREAEQLAWGHTASEGQHGTLPEPTQPAWEGDRNCLWEGQLLTSMSMEDTVWTHSRQIMLLEETQSPLKRHSPEAAWLQFTC